jgi:hypothetical protein
VRRVWTFLAARLGCAIGHEGAEQQVRFPATLLSMCVLTRVTQIFVVIWIVWKLVSRISLCSSSTLPLLPFLPVLEAVLTRHILQIPAL